MNRIDAKKIQIFQTAVRRYYRVHKRKMPWRNTRDPYKIYVSEVMLQQTQVSRVLQKYPQFIKKFSSFAALAFASPSAALSVWQGLGYNRRALLLKKCAEIVAREHNCVLPRNPVELEKLPGIGKATAGAIAAFAFNVPVPFIETNIRRVFIHFFFSQKRSVRDEDILKLVAASLPQRNIREWYYALMDYGAMLAKTIPNPNKKSASYARQPRFRGSDRELRGKILKFLLRRKSGTVDVLRREIGGFQKRIQKLCEALTNEGLLRKKGRQFAIPA